MKFELTILGSNSAFPTSERNPTAHVLNVHERFFLIDCGEGTQMQIRKNHINFSKINNILISHLHGDHYFGIFGLISTFRLLGRKHDLNIFGPPELEKIVKYILGFNPDDIGYKLNFFSTDAEKPTVIFEDKILTITSFPLKHRIHTCGFVFREKQRLKNIRRDVIEFYNIPVKEIHQIKEGKDFIDEDGNIIQNERLTIPSPPPRSYAFCSDTAYFEDILPYINNVDLLYHEATYLHELEKMAQSSGHSTSLQAASIARKANVKKLIIGHFSARYKDVTPLIKEAREVFPETYEAKDDLVYSVDLIK